MPITITTSGPIYTITGDSTYSGLITKVGKYLARGDTAEMVPGWITEAEDVLNYGTDQFPPLRCREMEVETPITMTDGVGDLPGDFLQVKTFKDSASNRLPMSFITQDEAIRRFPDGAGGVSSQFTVLAESIKAYPISTGDFTLVFYQKIPPLSDLQPSNWLSEKNHSIYLHLVLSIGFDYLRNDQQMGKHAQLAVSLINGMNRSAMMSQYSRAGLTMRGATP